MHSCAPLVTLCWCATLLITARACTNVESTGSDKALWAEQGLFEDVSEDEG